MPDTSRPISPPPAQAGLRYRRTADGERLEGHAGDATVSYSVTHGTQDAAVHIESRVQEAGAEFARIYRLETTYDSAKGWLETGLTKRYPISPEQAALGIRVDLEAMLDADEAGRGQMFQHPGLIPFELSQRLPVELGNINDIADTSPTGAPVAFPQPAQVNGRPARRR